MESAFLANEGSLSDKLMAAMLSAKIPGADARCTELGVSSLSAYIIVAREDDSLNNFYLKLNVEFVSPKDPIDVLNMQYIKWKTIFLSN